VDDPGCRALDGAVTRLFSAEPVRAIPPSDAPTGRAGLCWNKFAHGWEGHGIEYRAEVFVSAPRFTLNARKGPYTMLNILRATATVAFMLVVGAGCVPHIGITTFQPAKYNLGRATQLTVVQSEGRRSAREFIISELTSQARTTGRLMVKDRTEEGITVKIVGRTVQVSGGTGAGQTAEEVGVRLDVLEYGATSGTEVRNVNGRSVTVPVVNGKVVLAATVFNAKGRAILSETEYIGKAALENASEDVATQAAARQAVAQLLHDITPLPVQNYVQLDNSDKLLEPVIETAKAGNISKAIEDTKAFIEKNPNHAGAHYNLGVFLDSQGAYEEALGAYDKSITLKNTASWVRARAECAKRLSDAKALQE
jgi:hypothetical protein